MTEKRARALHRALWHWMAKHPRNHKTDWPGWQLANKNYHIWCATNAVHCFACGIAHGYCDICPISDKAKRCNNKDSLWHQYKDLYINFDIKKWEDICNQMADSWQEISE